jgi:cleavage and polyadenylation specificity factor subunit 6/7
MHSSGYNMHSSAPSMSRSSSSGSHPQGANNVHLNPAFIQGGQSHNSPPDYNRGPSSAGYGDYRSSSDISHSLSEAEADEILSKNRTVCSGAISRAVGDAASGKTCTFFRFFC